ncbi:MAG TPA: hypothetical protein VKH19_12075 [Gemmatimonadaceae bacterium]|nr:hypothetical protein [Gemmatimonadaceae bacterium]
MAVMPWWRRVVGILGLLLLSTASLLVVFAALELMLRRNVIANQYYLQHEVLGANKTGPLVLILGDSFMAPLKGADIADYLYDSLSVHGVRIRNSAVAGTGPVEYLQSLRREAPLHHPQIVLLSYYVGNDLLNVGCGGNLNERLLPTRPLRAWQRLYVVQFVAERLRAVFPGRAFLQMDMLSLPPGALWAIDAVTRFARKARVAPQSVDYEAMKKAGIPAEHIEAARAGTENPWIVSLGAIYPDYFRDELLMRSECAQRAWSDTKRVLDLILAGAARIDATVLPVVFPHTLQVSSAHLALYRAWKLNIDDEMLHTDRPQQLLREYFESRGLEPLDLLDVFRSRKDMLYWERDEHMNAVGQKLSAALIAAAILDRGPDSVVAGRRPRAVPRKPRLPALSPVSLPLHLAIGDSAAPFLMGGFYPPESIDVRTFRWSRGRQSEIDVPLPVGSDIRMDFGVSPLDFPRSDRQRITISLNDIVIATVALQPGLHTYSATLPARLLGAAPAMLNFRYRFAATPHNVLRGSIDTRELAVAWYSIDFTRAVH